MELRRFRLFEAKRDLREVGPQRRSYELVLESRGCIRGYVTGIIEYFIEIRSEEHTSELQSP